MKTQSDKIRSVPDATAHGIIGARRKIGTSRFKKEEENRHKPNHISPIYMLETSSASPSGLCTSFNYSLELLRPGSTKRSAKTLKKRDIKSVLILQKEASLSHYSQNYLVFS